MLSGNGGGLRKFHDQAIRPSRSRDVWNNSFTQGKFDLDLVRGPVNSYELNLSRVLAESGSAYGNGSN
jgi:hypothetical protein